MFPSLKQRRREAEWMDAPDADPAELRRSLVFIRRINALLGYTRVMVQTLRDHSHGWTPGQRVSILDVATGSADVPAAMLAWAGSAGFDVRLTAVDLHGETLSVAAAALRQTASHASHRNCLVQADARTLPFADDSIDYVLSAMFLHHLAEADAVAVLREMARVARRGVIVSDLLRHRRAYAWICLFTLFAGPMVRHDARVSVAQAFTDSEILQLCAAAGLRNVVYRRRFGYRFVITAT